VNFQGFHALFLWIFKGTSLLISKKIPQSYTQNLSLTRVHFENHFGDLNNLWDFLANVVILSHFIMRPGKKSGEKMNTGYGSASLSAAAEGRVTVNKQT
jgi:hypothetical protein